jgi:glycerol-3-phosphate dehydrogenase
MKRVVESLAGETFDVLILGGGITGAGIALDAALRGFRVALIDKGDFASGTSSVSSKLVHGGLRYLEHGGFHLVYEALHERALLLQNAPHIVRPLRFLIPFSRASRVSPLKWRTGLALYDILAGRVNLQRSRPIDSDHLLHECPELETANLSGGASYYDAQMDDARLCLEVLHTAVAAGAQVVNYVEALAFEKSSVGITGIRALDRVGGREFSLRARQVVNAAGPWVDQVCRLAGEADAHYLQPTKGVHLVVSKRYENSAFLLLHPKDGRVFFVIPWMGKTLIGTTDTFCDQPPEQLSVTAEEIAYLIDGHNHYFKTPLTPAEVMGSFAGLRPLLYSRPDDPSSVSREFRLFRSKSGLLSVAGGKYTTYRRMAEIVTDAIANGLGRNRRNRTRTARLHGAPAEPWPRFAEKEVAFLNATCGLGSASARHLVDRYGTLARQVAGYLEQRPELGGPVVAGEPDLEVELAYQQDQEMAIYPADSFLRRTRLGLFHPSLLAKGA